MKEPITKIQDCLLINNSKRERVTEGMGKYEESPQLPKPRKYFSVPVLEA